MPASIDQIKINKLKSARIQGKNKRQALLEAGYSNTTASHNAHRNKALIGVDNEILSEARKRKIIDKAWIVLENSLDNPKYKHTIANNIASKDMTAKQEVKGIEASHIVITYNKEPSTRLPLLNNSASNSLLEPSKPISSEDLT